MTNREFYTAIAANETLTEEIRNHATEQIAKLDATAEKRKGKVSAGPGEAWCNAGWQLSPRPSWAPRQDRYRCRCSADRWGNWRGSQGSEGFLPVPSGCWAGPGKRDWGQDPQEGRPEGLHRRCGGVSPQANKSHLPGG